MEEAASRWKHPPVNGGSDNRHDKGTANSDDHEYAEKRHKPDEEGANTVTSVKPVVFGQIFDHGITSLVGS